MVRVHAEPERDRHDERDDHHDGGEDVHQHADADEKDVQRDEEHHLRSDEAFHRLEDHHRDAGLNQEGSEADRSGEDRQDGANQRHGLSDDARKVFAEAHVPVDPHLDDERVDRRERRGLVDAKETAVHAAEKRNRKQRLPFGLPECLERLSLLELGARHLVFDARGRAVDRQGCDGDDPRDEPGEEELLDHDPGDDAVDDHRNARREEKPEGAAGGDQSEREILVVLVLDESRVEKTADGNDRDSAAAGEGREEGGRNQADHRQAARHPTQPGAGELHQAVRGATLGKHVACEREERDGDKERRIGEFLAEDIVGGAGDARVGKGPEEQHRCGSEDREQR